MAGAWREPRHERQDAAAHRHGRHRLHGPHPQQRLSPGRASSSTCRTARCWPRSAPAARGRRRRSPTPGVTSSAETDWRALVERPDIDLIDIASPNDTHCEIALAAAAAGKMVLCEKPLGRSAEESERMVAAVEAAGVANMVWYNYRRVPAVTLAKLMVDEGRLGRIFHYRAKFLQDWTISQDLPQGGAGLWRLDASVAGSGVTGDLLAHCIDTAMWLNGGISRGVGDDRDVHPRADPHAHRRRAAGDHRRCQRLPGALRATAPWRRSRRRATRAATRRLYTLEINGEHGSIAWDLHDLHRLSYFDHGDSGRTRGWRSVHITDGDHPYMKQWWVPGLQIGYEHTFIHQVGGFPGGAGNRHAGQPDIPRWAGDRPGDRCGVVLRTVSAVGDGGGLTAGGPEGPPAKNAGIAYCAARESGPSWRWLDLPP